MSTKLKRRLVVVTGIIIALLAIILVVTGRSTAAQSVTVAEAATGDFADKKIQVSGNVVDDSFEIVDDVLVFSICDPEDVSKQVRVRFEGGVSATFGNGVTAICTGTMTPEGVLNAVELVTKCPSKYENATDALTVSRLLEYGDTVFDKPVKVIGALKEATLAGAEAQYRFVLVDTTDGAELPVIFDGALSDDIKDASELVLTGSLNSSGKFVATDIALRS